MVLKRRKGNKQLTLNDIFDELSGEIEAWEMDEDRRTRTISRLLRLLKSKMGEADNAKG